MKIAMFLFSVATGYLSWIMADGFLFAMAIVTLILGLTTKHWVGKDE